jgi:hypothetical protein
MPAVPHCQGGAGGILYCLAPGDAGGALIDCSGPNGPCCDVAGRLEVCDPAVCNVIVQHYCCADTDCAPGTCMGVLGTTPGHCIPSDAGVDAGAGDGGGMPHCQMGNLYCSGSACAPADVCCAGACRSPVVCGNTMYCCQDTNCLPGHMCLGAAFNGVAGMCN